MHAARIVISLRALVNVDWIQETGHLPDLVDLMNKELPADIRVFAIVKVKDP